MNVMICDSSDLYRIINTFRDRSGLFLQKRSENSSFRFSSFLRQRADISFQIFQIWRSESKYSRNVGTIRDLLITRSKPKESHARNLFDKSRATECNYDRINRNDLAKKKGTNFHLITMFRKSRKRGGVCFFPARFASDSEEAWFTAAA